MLEKSLIELLSDIEEKRLRQPERNCDHCGQPYRGRRPWQLYCSPICKFNHHKAQARLKASILQAERAKLKAANIRPKSQAFLEAGLKQVEEDIERLKESNSELRRLLAQEWETRAEESLLALRAMGIVGNTHNDEGAGHG